jgi:hypothetical protein
MIVDPVHQAVALGNAAAARAIHADRVHLVEIGHGVVRSATSQISAIGADVAVHRIDAFKRHQLRRAGSSWAISSARCLGSLWRKKALLGRLWRMPSIIEAWLSASE